MFEILAYMLESFKIRLIRLGLRQSTLNTKVRYKIDSHFFRTFLLETICLLSLIIIAISCYYIKHLLNENTYYHINHIKLQFEKLISKIVHVVILMT